MSVHVIMMLVWPQPLPHARRHTTTPRAWKSHSRVVVGRHGSPMITHRLYTSVHWWCLSPVIAHRSIRLCCNCKMNERGGGGERGREEERERACVTVHSRCRSHDWPQMVVQSNCHLLEETLGFKFMCVKTVIIVWTPVLACWSQDVQGLKPKLHTSEIHSGTCRVAMHRVITDLHPLI